MVLYDVLVVLELENYKIRTSVKNSMYLITGFIFPDCGQLENSLREDRKLMRKCVGLNFSDTVIYFIRTDLTMLFSDKT